MKNKFLKKHTHKESNFCICGPLAEEPKEDCPRHGNPWPPRCGICGQFIRYMQKNEEKNEKIYK